MNVGARFRAWSPWPRSTRPIHAGPGPAVPWSTNCSKSIRWSWASGSRPCGRCATLYGPLAVVFRGKPKLLADRRLVAASVLADYAADRPSELADLACDADVEQFQLLWPVLEKSRKEGARRIDDGAGQSPTHRRNRRRADCAARHQAHAAAALMALGEPSPAWPILKHSRRPDGRTALIHGLATHGADPRVLIRRLLEETDDTIRGADPGAGRIQRGTTATGGPRGADHEAAGLVPQRSRPGRARRHRLATAARQGRPGGPADRLGLRQGPGEDRRRAGRPTRARRPARGT